jgi:hypothetical protein
MSTCPMPPHPLEFADDASWHHHDLAKARALVRRPPLPGEVFVWIVPTEFRFTSASNIGNWLSVAERRRARLHPNSALGRRFGVARATLRLVLSHMFGCRPGEVEIEDKPDERVAVRDPRSGVEVGADVAYSGIWIVVAVASARIGLGVSVDAGSDAAAARGEVCRQAADICLERASRNAGTAAASGGWHGLVLPMPGEICGVAALDGPVERVHAFGWERMLDQAQSQTQARVAV